MAFIRTTNGDIPLLIYVADGYEYSFSVAGIPEETQTLLCEVIQGQANTISRNAYRRGREEVRKEIKVALGINDSFD